MSGLSIAAYFPATLPYCCINNLAKCPQYQEEPVFAVSLSAFLEFTASDIEKTRKKSQVVYPPGKPMTPHLLRCQGFGVANYSQTLERLEAAASSTFATLG